MTNRLPEIIDAVLADGTLKVESCTLINRQTGACEDALYVVVRDAKRRVVSKVLGVNNTDVSDVFEAIAKGLAGRSAARATKEEA